MLQEAPGYFGTSPQPGPLFPVATGARTTHNRGIPFQTVSAAVYPALLSFTIYSYTLFYPQPPPSLPLSTLCKSLAIQSIRSFTYRIDRPTDCNSYLFKDKPSSITQSTTSSLCTTTILTNPHLRIHSVETLGTSLNRLALQLGLFRLVSAA